MMKESEETMLSQETFVEVNVSEERVTAVMTEEALMRRWMSPAVQFAPLAEWSFAEGARWRMQISGTGRLLQADYVVYERRPNLILWSFDGFWQGFDAWHWFPRTANQTIIQNRLEYALNIPGLAQLWPLTIGPLMGWDAEVQMQRLKTVCEE